MDFRLFFNCPPVCGLSPLKSREYCVSAAYRSYENFTDGPENMIW